MNNENIEIYERESNMFLQTAECPTVYDIQVDITLLREK